MLNVRVCCGNTQLLRMLAASGVMGSGSQVVRVMFVAINLFAKSPVQECVLYLY